MSHFQAKKIIIEAIKKRFGTVTKYAETIGLTKSAMHERLQKISYKTLYELKKDGIISQDFIDWFVSDQSSIREIKDERMILNYQDSQRFSTIENNSGIKEALELAKEQIKLYKELYEEAKERIIQLEDKLKSLNQTTK